MPLRSGHGGPALHGSSRVGEGANTQRNDHRCIVAAQELWLNGEGGSNPASALVILEWPTSLQMSQISIKTLAKPQTSPRKTFAVLARENDLFHASSV
jgi:hypothetical protein